MNRTVNFALFSTALLLSALAASLPCQAAPKNNPAPRAAARTQAQPQVFTVRYVVFVATPKKAMTPEEVKASAVDLPPVFDELQNGSAAAVMNTTPEGFLNKMRGAQSDYKFERLLSGSVTVLNGSEEPAVIKDGLNPSDPYQTVLNEKFLLEWNSPTTLTTHQTGEISHSTPFSTGRNAMGWNDMHTDKAVMGHSYSMGIQALLNSKYLVYTYCILPGKLDQTASSWSKSKQAAVANKNAGRAAR